MIGWGHNITDGDIQYSNQGSLGESSAIFQVEIYAIIQAAWPHARQEHQDQDASQPAASSMDGKISQAKWVRECTLNCTASLVGSCSAVQKPMMGATHSSKMASCSKIRAISRWLTPSPVKPCPSAIGKSWTSTTDSGRNCGRGVLLAGPYSALLIWAWHGDR